MNKKKILIQTDFALAKTGFGRNAKAILKYLYNTNKYDLIQYSCGMNWSNIELTKVPWKSVGTLPDSQEELVNLNRDPNLARQASYGAYNLDKIIEQEKPDVYIAIQDIWGIDFAIDKPWFNKINSVLWTTLDSLPILDSAVACAPKVKNYWIWSDFATKALHNLGHNHVKTVHGALENSLFYRLSDSQRIELRKKYNINPNAFIVGFVFRNQLRKSVPNLLEGYRLWKDRNPEVKNSYLLLHTSWDEGWNIPKLCKEYNISLEEVLTTYVCKNCKEYFVHPFVGQNVDCPACKASKSCATTNVAHGVNENQLNEVYNLMDIYCHPFTSGGQEIPIQEAKLTELITLVTNYSCGEDMCVEEAGSIPLEWSEYREHGTEFRKASTLPNSIAKQLHKVWKMSPEKRKEIGVKAREWTIQNYSIDTIGKFLVEFIDSSEKADWSNISIRSEDKDPNFVLPDIQNDSEFIIFMYKNILKMHYIDENDDGYKYWMNEIKKGVSRKDIENYFRQVALQENKKSEKIDFNSLLDKNEKRILITMPESAGDVFMISALFESVKNVYPDHDLYIATKPEYFSILQGNPFVHKILQYIPQMDQLLWLEGAGEHKGFFEIAFLAHIGTQRILNYLHNAKDKIQFNIKDL